MVIERFGTAGPAAIGERFRAKGRQIPPDSGVEYVASWMAADGQSCFQIMEAPSAEALEPWIAAWADLAKFDVVPIQTSAAFWERFWASRGAS